LFKQFSFVVAGQWHYGMTDVLTGGWAGRRATAKQEGKDTFAVDQKTC
jgi:hypothetical protein